MKEVQDVVVKNFNISFLSLVWFLVKLAFAIIPAIFIVGVICVFMYGLIMGIGFGP